MPDALIRVIYGGLDILLRLKKFYLEVLDIYISARDFYVYTFSLFDSHFAAGIKSVFCTLFLRGIFWP